MAKGGRPNIVFFFSDQQRWDTVGAYGQRLNITPNLDRMAAEGVLFTNAFTCQPVCGPARACIQTGKYATETGCFRNAIALPLDEFTIAHRLRDAGYEAGYIGKWHLASTDIDGRETEKYHDRGVPRERRGGYDDFWLASDVLEFTSHSYDGHMFDAEGRRVEFPPGRFRADALGDFAVSYIETRSLERPFFLFLSFIEPHQQNDHDCFEGPRGSRERFGAFDVPGDLLGTGGDWREYYPDYLGCCNALDANLGRIREALARRGIADDTLIVYTSDHGCHFRTRNGEYKRSCHDSSVHVPLVVRGPGWTGGRVICNTSSLIDLPPTLLRAAGLEAPESMRGRALQDALEGPADWREQAFIQISESQVARALRTRKWKYSVTAPERDGEKDASSEVYLEEYLYDLEKDPHERRNLVADSAYAEVRSELREALIRRMSEAGEKAPEIRGV